MRKLRFVNGNGTEIDLTSYPFGITTWDGFSNVDLEIQSQKVPFTDGSVYLDSLLNERDLSVTLAINDEKDLSVRYELEDTVRKVLNPKLGEGYLYYQNDYLQRRIKVIPKVPLFPTHNANDSGTVKASLSFTACSPYWEDVEETTVTINSYEQKTINNNGDVPCSIQLEIQNPRTTFCFQVNKETLSLDNNSYPLIAIDTGLGKKSIQGKTLSFVPITNINNVLGVSYSKNKDLFYVATYNSVNISKDCETWKRIIVPTSPVLGVYYCDELDRLFVNGGSSIYYSDDNGDTFVLATTDGSHPWYSMTYGDGKLICVGSYDIKESTDRGETWQIIDTVNNYTFSKIIYGNNKFIAVGGYGTSSGIIAVSSDGSTWEHYFVNRPLHDIQYISSLGFYIAVGTDGLIAESSDGVTWSSSLDEDKGNFVFAFYIPWQEKIVIGGSKNYISSDGVTWTEEGSGWSISSYVRGGIAVSTNGLGLVWSDGSPLRYTQNYRQYNLFHGVNANVNDCIFLKDYNKFIAITDKVLISTDGIEWEELTDSFSNTLYRVCGNKNEVIIIENYKKVYLSTNLEQWNLIYSGSVVRDAVINDDYILVYDDTKFYRSSDKGSTWSSSSEYSGVKSLCYSSDGNLYIAVGTTILTSSDGVTWTEETNPVSSLKSVKEENGEIFAWSDKLIVRTENGWQEIDITSAFGVSITIKDIIYNSRGDYYIISTTGGVCILFNSNSVTFAIGISITTLCQNSDIIIGFNQYEVLKLEYTLTNIINQLGVNDTLNLELEVGENIVSLLKSDTNACALLTYRQKYLGV